MDIYKQIIKDQQIIDLYNNISILEDKNKGWNHHNLEHAVNVANMAKKMLSDLGYSQSIINDTLIAALLHDIGCIEGKDNHPTRSAKMAKIYLKTNNIKLNNEKMVIEAIRIHSNGFETDNIIAQVLIFADKLDIKKQRLAKAGYEVDGLKETRYINDILVNIDNNQLIINFIANEKIDKNKLESWYFMPKVFLAINSFAKKNNLEPLVLLNNKNW